MGRVIIVLMFLFLGCNGVAQAGSPVLHGYGGQECGRFLETRSQAEQGVARAVFDELAYSQWLAGLVSGLSLASGEDVLHGADVEGLMRRVQRHCEDDLSLNVMDAALAHIRDLSKLP